MRDLIIARLEELKEKENGFSKFGTMRWMNVFAEINGKVKHISEVEWCELDDETLLVVFERVIRRYNAQM